MSTTEPARTLGASSKGKTAFVSSLLSGVLPSASRPGPARIGRHLYARAVSAMRRIADKRGTWGICVDHDEDARTWRAWHEAALRQLLKLNPEFAK